MRFQMTWRTKRRSACLSHHFVAQAQVTHAESEVKLVRVMAYQ